jgi:hypothetical protein
MKKLLFVLIALVPLVGCARIDPLSPDLRQDLNNQGGKIDDLQNNQNGFLLELGKLKSEQDIMAENIGNLQQGMINKNNSGIQILQGDGALIAVFALGVIGLLLVYYYKMKSDKNEETAEILSQQIKAYGDDNLKEMVFVAAMNSNVEREIYNLIAN